MTGIRLILLNLMIWSCPGLFAQPGTFTLHGRILVKGKPAVGISARIVHYGSILTDSNGEFLKALPNEAEVVTVEVESGQEILFPPNGVIPLPKQENFVWDIYIGKKADQQDEFAALFKGLRELKANTLDTSLIRRQLAAYLQQQEAQTTLQLEALTQQFQLLEAQKRLLAQKDSLLQVEQKVRQQETLDLLSTSMDHYISRSRDLKDAFEHKGPRVFYNERVVHDLGKTIQSYSEAYEALNRNRKKIERGLETDWELPDHRFDTRELLKYALDHMHKETVLTTNELIEDINTFNEGRVSRARRRKKEINSDIGQFVNKLENMIEILERDHERISEKLKNG